MNGKLQVLSTILKLDNKPFRISHITDITGLDRNLVRYHVVNCAERGLLERVNKTYVVRDREGILNSLIESTEKTETAKMEATGLFTEKMALTWNAWAEAIIAGRTFDVSMSQEAKNNLLDKIDESVKQLKKLRKYLCNGTKTVGSAAKFFNASEGDIETAWKIYTNLGATGLDMAEFATELEEKMEEAE